MKRRYNDTESDVYIFKSMHSNIYHEFQFILKGLSRVWMKANRKNLKIKPNWRDTSEITN